MPDWSIKVENISKLYRIGLAEQRHETLVGTGLDFLRSPLRNLKQLRGLTTFTEADADSEDVIWALRDVSFEVPAGEVLGIIGANGAGKSTLLKILSGITEPTAGRALLKGRVASLLEVGTGFHPELTGRENVYLNGTILGMTKEEVDRKFDEIVAFSGVEKFIDTPVKRYSSGMNVRLAFAVAAHLEPEILLIDEVLAVGDVEFQKKCLSRIEDITRGGRTVLFVSHNLGAIKTTCSNATLLSGGTVEIIGPAGDVIDRYLHHESGESFSNSNSDFDVKMLGFRVLNIDKVKTTYFDHQESALIEIEYELKKEVENLLMGFDFLTSDGAVLFRAYDEESVGLASRSVGHFSSQYEIPLNNFQSGKYVVRPRVGVHRHGWISKDEFHLTIEIARIRKSDVDYDGPLIPRGKWDISKL